jgi:hypothetical protein
MEDRDKIEQRKNKNNLKSKYEDTAKERGKETYQVFEE